MSNGEDSELLWKAFEAKAHRFDESDGKNNELIFLIDEAQALFGAGLLHGMGAINESQCKLRIQQNYLHS